MPSLLGFHQVVIIFLLKVTVGIREAVVDTAFVADDVQVRITSEPTVRECDGTVSIIVRVGVGKKIYPT